MIKHIVMWKLKDFAEGQNKADNIATIKTLLRALPAKISEIKFLEVGINVNPSQTAYDAVLVSEFNSLEDLETYQNHPEHKKVSEFVGKVRIARAVADYEF